MQDLPMIEQPGCCGSIADTSLKRTSARAGHIDRLVGGRTRDRRVMIGLSQQQMAALIGVTRQQLQKYERGHNCMSVGRLYRIAHILGVPISWFFEMAEPQSSGDAALLRERL
jgi:DNA-binding XRE family transcriptional regulator